MRTIKRQGKERTYICIYEYMYTHICIYICVCIDILIYIYVYKHTHLYVYIHKYICICIYLFIYVYTCSLDIYISYIYIHVYVCKHMYTRRNKSTHFQNVLLSNSHIFVIFTSLQYLFIQCMHMYWRHTLACAERRIERPTER